MTNVLLVEDYPDAAAMLTVMLQNCGFFVKVANDGLTALGFAETAPPDLVLLDIGLPDMDGYEVARRLRTQVHLDAGVKIIALSGFQPNAERQRESGIDFYLMKPLDLRQLLKLIGR